MALAETTLSAAVAFDDKTINVASAASMVPGRMLVIDDETMRVAKDYSTGTAIPVLRGVGGSAQVAHVTSARVVHGDGSDFPTALGQAVPYPSHRSRRTVSITATTAALTLPNPGEDLFVVLNGTNAITITFPVPTKDLDGCELTVLANGVAQHVLTFTGGLGGVGSGYTTITTASAALAAYKFVAINEVWCVYCGAPVSGTATKVQGAIA